MFNPNFITRLVTTLAVLPMVAAPASANSIIQNHQNRLNQPASAINQPRNGGTTTLREKCEAISYFQNRGNVGKVLSLSFQVGYEHDINGLSADEACGVVGVNTYL